MINQLTFTRFLAAVLIVFFHFGEFMKGHIPFIDAVWEHFNLGVSYFYVLSGFVMFVAYHKLDKINSKSFLINRISRIYPLHLLTFAMIVIMSLLHLTTIKIPKLAALSHVFLIQSWIPRTVLTINSPAWSISVELFFYLLFPLLFLLFKKSNKKYLILFSFGFYIICQITYNYYFQTYYRGFRTDGYFLLYNPFLHLNSFIIGILAGYLYLKNSIQKSYDLQIFIIFICLVFVVYFTKDLFIHNGFFAPVFGLIIFLISKNNGWITRIFSNKKFVHLGNISFALYLLQYPIFILSEKIFSSLSITNKLFIFYSTFIALLIASHFVYKYFEIPVQNFTKKKLTQLFSKS